MRLLFNGMQVNGLANLAGRLWSAVLNLVAVPLVVRLLGMDAFGLVSFVTLLSTMLGVLDLGLATTINREASRLKALGRPDDLAALLRTFETVYWACAFLGCVCLTGASWLFADRWITSTSFSTAEVRAALTVAAFVIAIRWPTALYAGFLQGCQKQVLNASVQSLANTLKSVTPVVSLWLISPTITVYLLAQLAASFAEVALYFATAWWVARGNTKAKAAFRWSTISATWRFALTYSAFSVIGLVFSTSDRFMLARCLPIAQLGEYNIASTVCGVITLIGLSIGSALFPVLSAHYAVGRGHDVWRELQRAIQMMAAAAFGLLGVIIAFGSDIVQLWTREENLVIYHTPVLLLLGVGAFCNAVQVLLGSTLTSAGLNDALIKCNTTALVIVVPLNYFLIPQFGVTAAAGVSCAWQGGIMLYLAYRVIRCLQLGADEVTALLAAVAPYFLLAAVTSSVAFYVSRDRGSATTVLVMCVTLTTYYTAVLWKVALPRSFLHDGGDR